MNLPKSKRLSYDKDILKLRLGIISLILWLLLPLADKCHAKGLDEPWYPFTVYYLTFTQDDKVQPNINKKSVGNKKVTSRLKRKRRSSRWTCK